MSPELALLAALDPHVFTTADARAVGVTPHQLVQMVRCGELDHPARGLYAVASPEPLDVTAAHRRLAMGVCRLYPDAVLSHHSAVVAHGLPTFDLPLERVLAARPVSVERLAQRWVFRPTPDWLHGVPTPLGTATDVPQTLVLHALEHGAVAGLVALDRALHDGAVEMSQVEAMGALVAGWPRSHRVLTMLAYADGRSESVGESRLRVHLGMAGLDVEPQVVIRDEVGDVVARVDLAVRGTRVLIEFDGLVKYREGGSEALIAEKRREDELRRLGYVVVRFTWADLYRPERIVARVRAAVAADCSPLGNMTVPSA